MNLKLKVLSIGVIFFFGAQDISAQRVKTDTTKTNQIQEVVITSSYGLKLTPEQSSGSTARVQGAALEKPAAVSLDNALQGTVPGLISTSNSGQPGAATITLIRGLTSLTSGNDPLYILDGVPIPSGDISGALTTSNALSLINPNDIESVQVLKDGVSTSLYGSRGAAGVIIITTKSGKKGRSNIQFTSELGAGNVAFDKFKTLSAAEHVDLYALSIFNNPFTMSSNHLTTMADAREYAISDFGWDGKTDSKWSDMAQRSNPILSRYNLSYSGGVQNFSVYGSLGYLKQEGLSKNSVFDRYNGTLKANWKASDKLSLTYSANFGRTVQAGPTDGSSFSNPVFTSRILSPTQPIYNEDGTYNLNLYYLNPQMNPLAIMEADKTKGTFNKIITSVSGDYKFLPNFTYSTNFGIDYTNEDAFIFWNPDFGDGYNGPNDANGNGYLSKSLNNFFTWNWYNFIHYNRTFGVHDVSASVGMESTQKTMRYSSFDVQGFPAGNRNPYADLAANSIEGKSNQVRWGLVGYIARASYTYNKFITVTGSARRDGYSGFTDFYGNFYGAGGSIDITHFDAVKNVFKSLKLRASYGENGNQAVLPYQKFALYALSGNYLGTNAGYVTAPGATSDGLHWETSKKSNIGLDFAVGARNFVSGTLDFYKNVNSGQIYDVQNPPSTGFGTITKNQADSYSKGIEASLDFKIANKEDFTWNAKINYALNDTKVTYINGDVNPSIIPGLKAFFPGHNPTEWYMRLWAGVDSANGDPLWYTDETRTATTNNSNLAKTVFTGKNAMPKHIASFINEMDYKGLKLSFMLNYQGGYSVYDGWGWLYDGDGAYDYLNQFQSKLYDSWTPTNTSASNPKYIHGGNKGSTAASTRYLYKGDNIRLRNVELGYRFKGDVLNMPGLNSIYAYFRGVNLLTYAFDKKLYFDPEANSNAFTTTPSNLGYYDQTQPNMKQYMIGFTIDF